MRNGLVKSARSEMGHVIIDKPAINGRGSETYFTIQIYAGR